MSDPGNPATTILGSDATFAAAMAAISPVREAWWRFAGDFLGPKSVLSPRIKEIAGRSVAASYQERFLPHLIEGPVEPETEHERLAEEFGRLAGADHVAIGEPVFQRLAQSFSEAELVELWLWVGFMAGNNRFGIVLGLKPSTLTDLLDSRPGPAQH